jgi:hypothetical protein
MVSNMLRASGTGTGLVRSSGDTVGVALVQANSGRATVLTNLMCWMCVIHRGPGFRLAFFQVNLPMNQTIRICAESW